MPTEFSTRSLGRQTVARFREVRYLFCPIVRTDVRTRSFAIRRLNIWNSLPAAAVCATDLSHFKQMLDVHIHDMLYKYTD